MASDLSLRIDNLSLKRGSCLIFSDLSFVARGGDIVYVSGSNGSGKTSLLRCLSGLLPKSNGNLRASFQKQSFDDSDRYLWQSLFCYLGDRSPLYDHLSAAENIRFWYGLFHQSSASQTKVLEALHLMNLTNLALVPVEQFSTGQRRRLSLAINMLCPCVIKLLDEPDNNLDKDGRERLARLLDNYQTRGYITILSSHHIDLIKFTFQIDLDIF